MLRKLIIENYAIIDHIEVEFGQGLNLMTGETGAGKSIIIGAMNLLSGERLSGRILRKGAKKGYVEGKFDTSFLTGTDSRIAVTLLESAENDTITLRREITSSGGSRVYINGKQATLQSLRESVSGLFDLHGQHQHQTLLLKERYYDIIDRFGKSQDRADRVGELYAKISGLTEHIGHLRRMQADLDEKRDYLEFQLKEINTVDPKPGEEESLEEEWKILQNAEKIVSFSQDSYRKLYDADDSAASQIRNAQRMIEEISRIIPEIEALRKDLSTALVSVEESAAQLSRYCTKIEFDPVRLEEINQRMAMLRQIQKKYRTDIAGVLEKAAEIEKSLGSGDTLKEEIQNLEKELSEAQSQYAEQCAKLSKKRKKAAEHLQNSTFERLNLLGMGKSLFHVVVEPEEPHGEKSSTTVSIGSKTFRGDAHGIDVIDFYIATGKSERMLPVSEIASGGELSRLMLAMKSALMKADRVPVLIFDEIDTGISGRIAAAVGRELKNLAVYHQLLCITHLPQIACMADRHFSVEKREEGGRIVTRVRTLTPDERKLEIARLLAGDRITDHHLKSAEEMLAGTQ
ncbi:DNA repair protein RecN [candidate division KSB1 bacterium]